MKSSKPQKSMEIWPQGRSVYFSNEESILEVLLKNKISISHSCGGMGSCGTCRIKVLRGLEKFSDRNEVENEMAQDRQFAREERLACQNEPQENLQLQVMQEESDE